MTNEIILSKYGDDEIQTINDRSDYYESLSRSKNTNEAYSTDWKSFVTWCNERHLIFLPADPRTVRKYITYLADIPRSVSTIARSMTAISQAHKLTEQPTPTTSPVVTEVWRGIKRELGTSPRRAKPILYSDLKKIIDGIRPTFLGRRDAAILMTGWAGALRRSEITSLNREDIEFVSEGMVLTITRSKTDQNSEGYKIGIPFATDEKYCPTCRLKSWIKLAAIISGPIFFQIGIGGKKFIHNVSNPSRLSHRMINVIIKRRMSDVGYDTAGYSGHSLRAGFVTTAASLNIPEYLIQIHTRHRTSKSLRGYIRDTKLFSENSLLTIF